MHKVVVITINFNQSIYTLECINSILKSTYENFQIILIDNGSRADIVKYLNEKLPKDDRIIFNKLPENLGYVGGVNYGLKIASSLNPAYFLIMNNDTLIDQNAMSELVACSKRYKKKAIISGKVYHYEKPNIIQYTGSYYYDKKLLKESYPGKDEEDVGQVDAEMERDMIDDIFWLLPSDIIIVIGNYCNYFYLYLEQADYAMRAKKAGYKLIYTPKAKLWHKGSLSTGGGVRNAPRVMYWRTKSAFIFQFRHLNRKNFFRFLINKSLKITSLYCYTFFFNTKKHQYYKAQFLGMLYFYIWIVKRNPDNGYNPMQ